MNSHTTQTVTLYPGLHFPSSIALISPTAVTNHTPYISHGFPLSHGWVLFSIYHSSSDSYFTEPVPGQVDSSSRIQGFIHHILNFTEYNL